MSVRLERVTKAKLPSVNFDVAFWNEVGKLYEGAILSNILKQKRTDGARLKVNAPSTRERKKREGKPLLSLVDKLRRFAKGNGQSWRILRYLPGGTGIVIGPSTSELRELVRHVGRMGYVGFLGLGKDGKMALSALVRKRLLLIIQRNARR